MPDESKSPPAGRAARFPTDGVQVEGAAVTDRGRRRRTNEDAFVAGPEIFAVADGMGGHQGGEVASAIVADTLRGLAGPLDADTVRAAVARAHERILTVAGRDVTLTGMGTTVAGLARIVTDAGLGWAVFNVGDSRVYRSAEDGLEQLTVDHSEVEELIAAGVLDREHARTDPRRNVITRSLGGQEPPQVDLWVRPPAAGERFLICTDGLTTELTDLEIEAVLVGSSTNADAARRLVAAAVAAGGRDNVTALVVARIADPATAASATVGAEPSGRVDTLNARH